MASFNFSWMVKVKTEDGEIRRTVNLNHLLRGNPSSDEKIYRLQWLYYLSLRDECGKCGGKHSLVACPSECCYNCGKAGHWDYFCPDV
jgi:hypothetical protein